MGASLVVVGIDVGQKVDPTAIVVCEVEERELEPVRWEYPKGAGLFTGADARRIPAKTERVYLTRHLARLPLGTPYPGVAAHVAGVVEGLVRRGVKRPKIMVDATGVGMPIVELIGEKLGKHGQDLFAVTFSHGDRYSQDDSRRTANLGKAYLVSKLQSLLQTGRLKLPKTTEAEVLGRELQDYEIRVDDDANDRYGAFRTGAHDDLATALGLCVAYREPTPAVIRSYSSEGIFYPKGGY